MNGTYEITDRATGGKMAFERIRPDQLEAARAIYNRNVRETTHTFSVKELDADEMRALLFFGKDRWFTYAVTDGDETVGYATVSPFKAREAYDISGEITVYLREDHTHRGIGPAAVGIMEKEAAARGIHSLVAVICAENIASVAMFEAMGYQKCAHFKEIGVKFGRMLDVVDYQKTLK
jgi:phosphinothricin acetyltransferase